VNPTWLHTILSLDSAKDQGLVTSLTVEYMETRAYFLARGQYCIKARAVEKIAIPEIVDTIAGSETGALVASNLLIPSLGTSVGKNPGQINERWADTTSQWFADEINTFYYDYLFPMAAIFFCSIIVAGTISVVLYRITDLKFKSEQFDDILSDFNKILS